MHGFGRAANLRPVAGHTVAAAATPTGAGLWLAGPDGVVRTTGDAAPLPTARAYFRPPSAPPPTTATSPARRWRRR